VKRLIGRRIAAVVTDGFEESELTEPLKALKNEGAIVHIVAPDDIREIRGWKEGEWTVKLPVDRGIDVVGSNDYDALLIPGGVLNTDALRMDEAVVDFVEEFFSSGKPVAAICHGAQLLIEADVVSGRELTSYSSIRTDLENAGAIWFDREVVVDNGLVTSRSPRDLPAFINKMIEEFREGIHEHHHV